MKYWTMVVTRNQKDKNHEMHFRVDICVSYPLVGNKQLQILWLRTTDTDHLVVSAGRDPGLWSGCGPGTAQRWLLASHGSPG